MKLNKSIAVLVAFAGMTLATSAQASTNVVGNITTDTTFTKANSPYFLKNPVYVINGASLTIEAGVTVITLPADDGGLVITRGSQIFALGTQAEPIIFTSAEDVATWTGTVFTGPASAPTAITTVGDRKTGVWRDQASEWRNITILGKGVLSGSEFKGVLVGPSTTGAPNNPTVVDGTAQRIMEGLDPTTAGGDINNIRYGGNDDNDDSGVLRYISSRYTGRVLGAGDELNGLSLGALGAETDLTNIDIMNNVDDGIEIWGGKVNLKYINIWNIGDDSFDVDQGWRGKVQFGLIVQGVATPASSGSGAPDNAFEMDGGEQSNVQPSTTATFYNFTVIGVPQSPDHATAWRDNANAQIRKSIFIDFLGRLVSHDASDGDGGKGYTNIVTGVLPGTPAAGLSDFLARFTTAYNSYPQYNAGSGIFAPTSSFYSAQSDGFLSEISDSVFHKVSLLGGAAGASGDQAVAAGVLAAGFTSNPTKVNVVDNTNLPITSLTRGTPFGAMGSGSNARNGLQNVVGLNPIPLTTAALTAQNVTPVDPFFTPTSYRGAFSPTHNWIKGWTAADAFTNITIDGPVQADPASTLSLSATVSFPTVNGVMYVIESSTDGRTWSPETVITGNGSTMTYTDTGTLQSAKLFRTRPL